MNIEPADTPRGALVLVAASLLCLLLGSVHAFSVFLQPLESQFEAPRSMVSLTYSLALVSITMAVFVAHRVFARKAASWIVAGVCIAAAIGALVAAQATSLIGVWIGYSLMFGGANGFGYALGLNSAALANPGREGFAMGIVTAAYALGAAVSPILFAAAIEKGGFALAMQSLALALVILAPVCALAMRTAGIVFRFSDSGPDPAAKRPIALLWIAYAAGVAAGLMATGHAAGIAAAANWQGESWITPALIAAFSMAGSFAGGSLADCTPPMRLLIGLPLLSACALAVLAGASTPGTTLCGLAVVGFCYGAIIAVFPSATAKLYGTEEGARVYGKVFTAWGSAGLLAPWVAGFLYDRTAGYGLAMLLAASVSIVSSVTAVLLRRRTMP